MPEFFRRWGSPRIFLKADKVEVANLIGSLGFCRRRTLGLMKMTEAYLAGGWGHAKELPGIGNYGAAAWEIFCKGVFQDEPPEDHALVLYWKWYKCR